MSPSNHLLPPVRAVKYLLRKRGHLFVLSFIISFILLYEIKIV